MTDIVITPANVIAGSNAAKESGIAGTTITAGQLVYRDSTTRKYLLADSNGTAEAKIPRGIALHAASLDQPLEILRSGDVTIGATVVAGTDYYLSDTPGGIAPRADVGAGENVVLVGLAKSTSVIAVDIQAPGVAV